MKKTKLAIVIAAVVFFGMTLLCWIPSEKEYSMKERRKLAQFPELTVETVLSGKFMSEFENYVLDQFPMRDFFLEWKQRTSTAKDENGLYEAEGHLVSMEYPLDEESLAWAAELFRKIRETYASKNKVYLSVIPDKNAFLGNENGYLCMDYAKFYELMKQETGFSYVDISDLMGLEDYYYTDGHWKQEKIVDVAARLAQSMGTEVSGIYEEELLSAPFYGAYYGQLANGLKADELRYLTNDTISNYEVFDHQNNRDMDVYDMEKAYGKDAYEIYLSGSLSLVTIENPICENGKELVLFRDSFGSSIAPLLAEGYEKVTLVDIRYINSGRVCEMIDFTNADVLFLYSTSVLNHSETLK